MPSRIRWDWHVMNPSISVSSVNAQLTVCISFKKTARVPSHNQLGNAQEFMFHMFPPSILPKLKIYKNLSAGGKLFGANCFHNSWHLPAMWWSQNGFLIPPKRWIMTLMQRKMPVSYYIYIYIYICIYISLKDGQSSWACLPFINPLLQLSLILVILS